MKGERRHELEKNELADWLATKIEWIKPYQNAILAVVLLVVVAVGGYSWWAWQSAGRQADAWDAFYTALNELASNPASARDFEVIVDDYPDSDVAPWARILAADLHLALGCDELFRDKATANQELREAVDHYRAILDSPRSNPTLRERATFGLARACESQGKLQEAVDYYDQIGQTWPEGTYAAAAAQRLEDLERPETGALYDRFAKFDPKPASFLGPDGLGERPAFDFDGLRDDEPLFEPKLLDLQEKGVDDEKPGDSSGAPVEPDGSDTGQPGTEPSDTDAAGADASEQEPPATEPSATDDAGADASEPERTGSEASAPAGTDSQQTDPADSTEPTPQQSE